MSDHFTTYVVGYDARVSIAACRESWDSARRCSYLYKEDSFVPLSTDTMVWERAVEPVPKELPFTGHQQLWISFPRLRSLLNCNADVSAPLIAIEIVLNEDAGDELTRWREINTFVEPPSLGAGWAPWGYDVSDRWLLSGLSNCGFLPEREDVDALKQRWRGRLNEYHLFDDAKDAFEFKIYSDSRVVEHAPFLVFRLSSFVGDENPPDRNEQELLLER